MSFSSPDDPFDPADHACECPVCAFMVEHGLDQNAPIPPELVVPLNDVIRSAGGFVL